MKLKGVAVQQIEYSGLGLVAQENISAGSIILDETPLLMIPSEIKSSKIPWSKKVVFLKKTVENLPEDKKVKYLQLQDSKCTSENKKSAVGIFRTNNFALGHLKDETDHGVFDLISRVNHSCRPNSEVFWRTELGSQQLVAIQDIREGEEISICYLNFEDRTKPANERISILSCYGFRCSCAACGSDTLNDDLILKHIKIIREKLAKPYVKEEYDLPLCFEMDILLERLGSKISWRMTNLETFIHITMGNSLKEDNMHVILTAKLTGLQLLSGSNKVILECK